MLPLLTEEIKGMTALDHLHRLSQVLRVYGKTDANVLCLVGDNCGVNQSMSRMLKVPLIGCGAHKFNLAICKWISNQPQLEGTIQCVANAMKKASTLKVSAQLWKLTKLNPEWHTLEFYLWNDWAIPSHLMKCRVGFAALVANPFWMLYIAEGICPSWTVPSSDSFATNRRSYVGRSLRFIWQSDGRLPLAWWTSFRRFEDCCRPRVWASSVEAFKESDAHGCGTAKCILPTVARCEWRCKQWCCWFCTTLYYYDKKCSAAGTDVLTDAQTWDEAKANWQQRWQYPEVHESGCIGRYVSIMWAALPCCQVYLDRLEKVNVADYYLRSIPLVHFDFLVEEILAFHRNVIRFV